MGIDVNFVDKLIYIHEPQQDLDIQDLVNEIRHAEASVSGISYAKIVDAGGKERLASGVYAGITVSIYDPWQLKFWQGNYQSYMTGGNLVRQSGTNPVIAYTAGVHNILLQSRSSTIVEPEGTSSTEIAAEVDIVLSAAHGSGNWEGGGGLSESGIALAVDVQLTSTKGGPPWTSLTESGIADEVDYVLSAAHGVGNWEGGGGLTESGIAAAIWDAQMSAHAGSGTAGEFLNFIQDIEGGRWRITSNQMIFYAEDNTTEVARFNLYDKDGNPANDDVYERRRV